MEQITVRIGDLDCLAQVTKDEWKEILSNKDFMSNNYRFALSIFFIEPGHKATCKFLAEKYNLSPSSLSGFITQFSARVQGSLNRFEIIKEGGAPNWWLVTMTGKKISGGLFEWTMRQELVDAMLELDYVYSSPIYVDSLDTLIKHINNDLSEFIKIFRNARKSLANKERATTAGILYKYTDKERDWAINEGGHNEVQYHIFLRNNILGYGLGFNTQYVPFKDEKTPIEYAKPFTDALLSLQDSDEVSILVDRGFSLDVGFSALRNIVDNEYYLFGREFAIEDNKLPLIDYYSIINDLKGDLFNLYEKVFEAANKLNLSEEKYDTSQELEAENPLVEEIIQLLQTNKNIILTGAPGTGKTYLAKKVVEVLNAESEFVQFHPSYDYTDFVEGLRPTQNDKGEVGFELRDGIFKAFCKDALKHQKNQKLSNFDEIYQKFIDEVSENGLELVTPSQAKPFQIRTNSKNSVIATPNTEKQTPMIVTKNYIQTYFETGKVIDWKPYLVPICDYIKTNYDLKSALIKDKDKKFVIILDEINRAEISKVLGELFFSIDAGYRGEQGKVKTQYANLQTDEDVFKDGFYIPDNVYIIGTMNDIDRSVESFDFAMRRRFAWKEIKAKDRLSMWEGEIDQWIEEAKIRLQSLNKAIESIQGLNSGYHVGPAYFLKLANYNGDFEALWSHHLKSLIFEYLRGYPDADEQLENLKNAYSLVDSDDTSND